jgi:hypothetical protein
MIRAKTKKTIALMDMFVLEIGGTHIVISIILSRISVASTITTTATLDLEIVVLDGIRTVIRKMNQANVIPPNASPGKKSVSPKTASRWWVCTIASVTLKMSL